MSRKSLVNVVSSSSFSLSSFLSSTIFIGDPHVTYGVYDYEKYYVAAINEVLKKNPKVSRLLILGDVFDSLSKGYFNVYEWSNVIRSVLKQFPQITSVEYLAGNHDVGRNVTLYDVYGWDVFQRVYEVPTLIYNENSREGVLFFPAVEASYVKHVASKTQDVYVSLFDYVEKLYADVISELKQLNLDALCIISHNNFDEIITWDKNYADDATAVSMSISEIKEKSKIKRVIFISGHVHKPLFIRKDGVEIYNVGNFLNRTFNDTSKLSNVLTFTDDLNPVIVGVNTDVFLKYTITASDVESGLKNVLKDLSTMPFSRKHVKITYARDVENEDYERLAARVIYDVLLNEDVAKKFNVAQVIVDVVDLQKVKKLAAVDFNTLFNAEKVSDVLDSPLKFFNYVLRRYNVKVSSSVKEEIEEELAELA